MDDFNKENRQKKYISNIYIAVVVFIVCILGLLYSFLLSAPPQNKETIIHITKEYSLGDISSELKSEKVIRSSNVFKILVRLFKSDRQIQRGDFLFKENSSVFKVAWQIAFNHHNINPLKITLKEGVTNKEIINIFKNKLSNFDENLFLNNEKVKQGYLFPDTYLFFPMTNTEEVVDSLSNNFMKKISSLNSSIQSSGKSLSDIIIMASIIEKEASGEKDASIISGILWKRIKLGMPLQVDVDISTYKNKGLSNEPINNPGLASIKASINPEASPYLYYLHDKNGVAHFAKTYDEHRLNINKYLK